LELKLMKLKGSDLGSVEDRATSANPSDCACCSENNPACLQFGSADGGSWERAGLIGQVFVCRNFVRVWQELIRLQRL